MTMLEAEIGVEVDDPGVAFEEKREAVAEALGLEDSGFEEHIAEVEVVET